MELGGDAVEPLDADRSHHAVSVTDDEEGSARWRVVLVEPKEIGHLDTGLVDKAVLRVDATDEVDHAGRVSSRRRHDAERVAGAHATPRTGREDIQPGPNQH